VENFSIEDDNSFERKDYILTNDKKLIIKEGKFIEVSNHYEVDSSKDEDEISGLDITISDYFIIVKKNHEPITIKTINSINENIPNIIKKYYPESLL